MSSSQQRHPSRITILAMGSRGDVQPYLALALGLQAQGHEVRFAAYTNFEQGVRSRALSYVPVLGDYHEIVSGELGARLLEHEPGQSKRRIKMEETGQNPLLLARHFLGTINPLIKKGLADCLHACEGSDLVVCSTIGFFYAHHVAEKLGVPYVPAFLQPIHPTRQIPCMPFPEAPSFVARNSKLNSGYNLLTYWAAEKVFSLLRRATNRARREALGLPAMDGANPFRRMVGEQRPCMYAFSETVLPKPSDWRSHIQVTGYWFLDHSESWQPQEELVDFLSAGPPPVSIGFGSMNERNPEQSTEMALEALKLSGNRGVLLTGFGGLANADLPDEVFAAEEIPHDWLFPRMAAAVHHGGAGTIAASLRAGTPTVIVPFIGDQAMWGRRVHALGAGTQPIPHRQVTVQWLATAIRNVTGNKATKQRAAAVGESIRGEDGISRAVEVLHTKTMDWGHVRENAN